MTSSTHRPTRSWLHLFIAGAASLVVLTVLNPQLLLTATTPAGGDMGAHVLGPAFLRDVLHPAGQDPRLVRLVVRRLPGFLLLLPAPVSADRVSRRVPSLRCGLQDRHRAGPRRAPARSPLHGAKHRVLVDRGVGRGRRAGRSSRSWRAIRSTAATWRRPWPGSSPTRGRSRSEWSIWVCSSKRFETTESTSRGPSSSSPPRCCPTSSPHSCSSSLRSRCWCGEGRSVPP